MPKIIIALLMLFVLPANAEAMHFSKDFNYETGSGKASWYWNKPCGGQKFCTTVSGYDFTACWDEYPKGTLFDVSYNGNHVIVECRDRGHFKELGRVLDLSAGAFKQLAPLGKGIIKVEYRVLR